MKFVLFHALVHCRQVVYWLEIVSVDLRTFRHCYSLNIGHCTPVVQQASLVVYFNGRSSDYERWSGLSLPSVSKPAGPRACRNAPRKQVM